MSLNKIVVDAMGGDYAPEEVVKGTLDALEKDNDYLTAGGVFPKELIANFIKSKRAECAELSKIPTPAEFDKYYNL